MNFGDRSYGVLAIETHRSILTHWSQNQLIVPKKGRFDARKGSLALICYFLRIQLLFWLPRVCQLMYHVSFTFYLCSLLIHTFSFSAFVPYLDYWFIYRHG